MKIKTRNYFVYTLSVNFKSKIVFTPTSFFPPPDEWSGLMGVTASLTAGGHNKQIAKTKQNNEILRRNIKTIYPSSKPWTYSNLLSDSGVLNVLVEYVISNNIQI